MPVPSRINAASRANSSSCNASPKCVFAGKFVFLYIKFNVCSKCVFGKYSRSASSGISSSFNVSSKCVFVFG